ncbi:putative uncharacterized protein [Parachlamydia acanthamoebae UV-7]|uniref:Uncharacterized protein n=2 Tax=Parachlamydia acanthamoebae TaxID=83552 RepID=F8L1T9_PARAV|nr:hypothetical protein [Parachlamydia acanthamoebae]CCB87253.1 putative uncharacterized protein [Parachlamydia acanthamoebae UV-7]
MALTRTAATEDYRFPTATDGSKAKKGFAKIGRGFEKLGRGAASLAQKPKMIIDKKEGFGKAIKVAAGTSELVLVIFSAIGGVKLQGLKEVTTLVKGVKKIIDLVEVVDNVGELAGYLKNASKPRSVVVALWTVPKVASTVFFTVSSGMEVFEFFSRTFNVGTKALDFTFKGLGSVPIPVFGLVKDVVGGAGVLLQVAIKGRELYVAVCERKHATDKLTTWKKDFSNLDLEKNSEVDGKAIELAKDYKKKIDDYKDLLIAEQAYAANPGTAPKLDRLAKSKLAKGAANIRKWEKRRDLLSGAVSGKAYDFTVELIKYKGESKKAKLFNENRKIAKAVVGVVLNIAKVALIVTSLTFLATGLSGVPFAFILMGASLAINVGGLASYATWEFLGEKRVAAPAA